MAEDERQPPVYQHYLDDELCVVVEVPPEHDLDQPADLYEQVRQWLHGRVLPLVQEAQAAEQRFAGPTAGSGDGFARDLAPAGQATREHWLRGGSVLRRLDRPDIDPWLLFPGETGPSVVLCFYAIEHGAVDNQPEQSAPLPERSAAVRELVNHLNRHERPAAIGPAAASSPRLIAAMPHWVTAASDDVAPSGGPASFPEPAPAPNAGRTEGPGPGGQRPHRPADRAARGTWRYRFEHAELEALVQEQRAIARRADAVGAGSGGARVLVAVLDTSPTGEAIRQAAGAHPENWLLHAASDPRRLVVHEDDLAFRPSYFAHLQDRRKTPLVDHGLFVAGVVHDIAPATEVHLIRALDDGGCGDLLALIRLLRLLPERLLSGRPAGTRLVVNLSLMADLPPTAQLATHWYPLASQDPATLRQQTGNLDEHFQDLHSGLYYAMRWLREQGVLVVAAAGNDRREPEPAPEPRLPARYDGDLSNVVGVASLGLDGRPADFSNRANVGWPGLGVATLGGNTLPHRPAQPDLATIAPLPEHHGDATAGQQPGAAPAKDALIGIFSSPEVPAPGGGPGRPNHSGWVYWAGTSFSSAIISGILAALWSQSPALRPDAVVEHLTAFTTQPNEELRCRAILAHQEPVQLSEA